eukprot:g46108.t1
MATTDCITAWGWEVQETTAGSLDEQCLTDLSSCVAQNVFTPGEWTGDCLVQELGAFGTSCNAKLQENLARICVFANSTAQKNLCMVLVESGTGFDATYCGGCASDLQMGGCLTGQATCTRQMCGACLAMAQKVATGAILQESAATSICTGTELLNPLSQGYQTFTFPCAMQFLMDPTSACFATFTTPCLANTLSNATFCPDMNTNIVHCAHSLQRNGAVYWATSQNAEHAAAFLVITLRIV